MTPAADHSRARSALTIHPKATGTGLGGAVSVVVLYCLSSIWNIEPPPEVAAAVTVIASFVCAYLAPRA